MNSLYSSSVPKAHDALDAGAIVPASIEQDDLAANRQMFDVALEVPRLLVPERRGSQRDNSGLTRAQMFSDAFGGAVLSRCTLFMIGCQQYNPSSHYRFKRSNEGGLSIGALAKQTGSNVQTIRYYEHIGLLPTATADRRRQRRYGTDTAHRLTFIRHARDLGFSLDFIRVLMQLVGAPERPCGDVDRIAEAHLQNVEEKIAKLTALRAELRRMLKECSKGQIAECRVIKSLSDHKLCTAWRH